MRKERKAFKARMRRCRTLSPCSMRVLVAISTKPTRTRNMSCSMACDMWQWPRWLWEQDGHHGNTHCYGHLWRYKIWIYQFWRLNLAMVVSQFSLSCHHLRVELNSFGLVVISQIEPWPLVNDYVSCRSRQGTRPTSCWWTHAHIDNRAITNPPLMKRSRYLHNFWQETSSMKSARSGGETINYLTYMYIHGVYKYIYI